MFAFVYAPGVTAVFARLIVPVVVIGLTLKLIPVPCVIELTVPVELEVVPQE